MPAALPIDDLLAWYRRERRDLPWRATEDRPVDPYHVMVSEAMLQQTQVATVVPYFQRFVAAFPTVRDLANAEEQAVLKLWQGLGYYRRARHLHAAAQMIVTHHQGRVPDTVETLLALPGVGRYTAGAIASIAHGRPAPIVDGNVARVFARYFLLREPVDQPAVLKLLWQQAEDLVRASDHPGDFNQALMELGALVCTPASPSCLVCPLRDTCAGCAAGEASALPVKTPKKPPTRVTHTVLAVRKRGQYLFEQRPASGLWASMWQMPTVQDEPAEPSEELPPLDPGRWVRTRFGITPGPFAPAGSFDHATTHRLIRFVVYAADYDRGRLRPRTGRWHSPRSLDQLPLAKPQLRVLELLGHPATQITD